MDYFLEERTGSPQLYTAILILLTLIVLPVNVFAQKDNIRFEHLSLEHGLSQATIYCIMQDSQGFMWFGTLDGLNKYDGYKFSVYLHNPDNSSLWEKTGQTRKFCTRLLKYTPISFKILFQ